MGMSKKDFIALADVVRIHLEQPASPFGDGWVDMLANFCANRNPRFNRKRWLCYIRGENGPSGGMYSLLKKGKTNVT